MKIDYSALTELSLSKLAINCYAHLDQVGPVKATVLAEAVGKPNASIYYVLGQLIQKGLVSAIKSAGTPTYYAAVMLDEALANYYQYLKIELGQAIRQQRLRQRELKRSN